MAGEGRDEIRGTQGGETLSGRGGGDVIRGSGGDDVLYGFGAVDRDPASGTITVRKIADGFDQPLWGVAAPGRPDELFILEKATGQVKILDLRTGETNPTPFLDIPDGEFPTNQEQGVLNVAFHPDYAANGRFFVFMSNNEGNNEVREYRRSDANPDRADPEPVAVVMNIEHPQGDNHNGGSMNFGPDGLLYIATGDGGLQGDTDNSAQDPFALTGKILRIDIDGDDFPADPERNYAIPDDNAFGEGEGAPEVFARGLRNPWRTSFDRETGDFWIGDVGWMRQEEVNMIPAGSPGGVNFGWHIKEGDLVAVPDTPGNVPPDDPSLTDPIVVYDHAPQGSVTGGYVYRGPGGLNGAYVFTDFTNGVVRTVRVEDGVVVDYSVRNDQLDVRGGTLDQIASFAEDARGRLYAIGLDGEIFRMTPSIAASDGADRLSGGAGDDRIFGGAGADTLDGGSGDDRIAGGIGADRMAGGTGDDVLAGDAGRDTLDGGAGANRLRGGEGADTFLFRAAATDAATDVVLDFGGGDRIDVSAFDATFIGDDAFSGTAGELRVRAAGSATQVLLDSDGDGAADLVIRLRGAPTLGEGDFVL